jgi:hypothetical protein
MRIWLISTRVNKPEHDDAIIVAAEPDGFATA